MGEVNVTALRKMICVALMAVGMAVAIRGSLHCLSHGLPWDCITMSAISGGLIFTLGLLKLRCISGR